MTTLPISVTDKDGKEHLLVDLLALYENHSAIPMKSSVKITEQDQEQYPLYQIAMAALQKLAQQTEINCRPYQPIVLITIKKLLQKYRPHRFLNIGNAPPAFHAVMADLLHEFHEENKYYWLTNIVKENIGRAVGLQLSDYENISFPEKYFDFILFDEREKDTSFSAQFLRKALVSLRPYGVAFLFSRYHQTQNAYSEILPQTFVLDAADSACLITPSVPFSAWQSIRRTLPDAAARAPKNEDMVIRRYKDELRNTMEKLFCQPDSLSPRNVDTCIDVVCRAEDILLELYPHLVSVDIKFRMSELKEALINFRLGYAEQETVIAKHEILLREMNRYQEFI